MLDLAARVDPARAPELAARFASSLGRGSAAHGIATLLGAAYPALVPTLVRDPTLAARMAADGFASARDRAALRRAITARFGDLGDEARVRRELRLAARDERARVALREILPPALGGADVDVTSAELAALADVTLQIAVDEARFHVEARCGAPRTSSGAPGRFAVLGMGKLGGDELNAGSDVDLIYVYDTDDGVAEAPGGSTTLHDFWTRVAKRVTATLEEPTEDGFVWRVNLRLRPEGRGGPIVNSLAAAERYYEAFGRLWERAALLRARPVAGNLEFGAEVLDALAPFVWRRAVDPRIAVDMIELARRSRAELSDEGARDLKLRPGGIREAEFFAQTLQLVWGGKAKPLRVRGTLEALRRLRAQGFVSDREFRELSDAYLALRRAEHVVQTATGIQTHALPEAGADLDRTARALGFADGAALTKDFAHKTRLVAQRFRSLAPPDAARVAAPHRWTDAFAALERSNEDAFVEAVARVAGRAPASPFAEDEAEARWQSAARDLAGLARHPDAPLGARTREAMPELAETVLDGVVDASDPEQAARYLRRIFGRVRHPGIYAKLLVDDRRGLRRLIEAASASAFVGEAVANQPDLGDAVLFRRGAPSPAMARAEVVAAEQSSAPAAANEDDEEATIGALRGAKARVTIEVALADLAGELDTRGATLALSELADATLDAAARAVLGGDERGLAVLAMGKLGGREIGYGSDLDVLFLFAPERAPAGVEPEAYFGRAARRMMRLIGVSHAAGPGYELDTRLRPSGSQGLLVTSVDAFARYHGAAADAEAAPASVHVRAAAWERFALLRARAAAGDRELGARAMKVAHAAAYDLPFDARGAAEEIARLRARLERENSQERHGRYDVKLGRGGLVDVEFAVQLLQLEHGKDPRVRTPDTAVAIEALAACGYLPPRRAAALRDGHAFLRKLEQRLRVVHANAAQLLEERAPGLVPLARRMGIRAARGQDAAEELLARYREVTSRVREAYDEIMSRA